MKRLLMTVMAFSLPVAALAQQPEGRAATEGIVAAQAATVAASATSAAQAPAAPSAPHRRPSMVGYIDDSSISNAFRVRFDSGSNIQGADRAEFFYAKCGCFRPQPMIRGKWAIATRFSVSRLTEPGSFSPRAAWTAR